MLYELVVMYLGGWVVATLCMHAAGRRLSDSRSPSEHPLGVSVVAGALWPLLVIGVAELSSVAVYAKVHTKSQPEVGTFA